MDSATPGAGPTFAIVGMVFGLFLFALGFAGWRRKRVIEDTPTSTVRSLAMGRVELIGRAQAREALTASVSGRPCVYYRYSIEGKRENAEGQKVWTILDSGDSKSTPFYVQDNTGQVMVAPLGAFISLRRDLHFDERWDLGRIPRGFDPQKWRHYGGPLRFEEWRIEPNDPIFVLGFAQEGRAPGFFEPPQAERIFVGSDSSFSTPFVISDRSEADLRRQELRAAMLGIYGGAMLSVLSLFVLLRLKGGIARGDFARSLLAWSPTIAWILGAAGCALIASDWWNKRRRHSEIETAKREIHDALRAVKTDPDAMRDLDRDGDGHLSSEEWDAARTRVVSRIGDPSLAQRPTYGARTVLGGALLAAALVIWFAAG